MIIPFQMNDQFIDPESEEQFTIEAIEVATFNEYYNLTDVTIISYWLVGNMGTELELNHDELVEHVEHNELEEV